MSLTQALFSDSQAKVYVWVFGHPTRSFHLNELRRLTGLGSASLKREITRLASAGLITTLMIGNQRHISANKQSPIFGELRALTQKVLGASPMIRAALNPVSSKIALAFIYGSIAKETDTALSDVDILVVGNDLTLSELLEHLLPVEELLGRKINPTCYTIEEFEKRLDDADSFVNRVLSQPTIQLIGDISVFRST